MKTQVALTLAVLAGLQVVWADDGFFEDVEPMKPTLPIDPSWVDGPLKTVFDVIDSSVADPYIVGGREAVPHSHPHQVALMVTINGRTAFCGGSLISDQWVLTAAHCASGGVTNITALVGAHNIKQAEPTARRVNVEKMVVHPSWDPFRIRNDLALLKLEDSVTLDGTYVNTIRLPSLSQKSDSFWRKTATMTGWGKDSDKATTVSPVLREVDSYIVSNFYCSLRYLFVVVQDTNICASGWWFKSFGTCNGDSGGPMYVKESDGEKTIVGITSFGIALGCEWTWPPVFTRVTSYLDWIHQTTGIAPRP